jgi:polyisoprenoid-binding protein YceI
MSSRSILPQFAWSLVCALAVVCTAAAAEKYTADTVHSSLVFRVKHMNASYVWGRFNNLTGTFTLDEANPAASQFEFQVKADSVDTGNAKRDQHLKSPDFLNAVQFPSIAFKSQSVKKSGNGYEVTGDLTLHGVTKPISVQVAQVGSGTGPTGAAIAGIEATFSFKRSDFGMTKMVGPVSDDVLINLGIEGMRR